MSEDLPEHEQSEVDLWRELTSDVRPIKARPRARTPTPRISIDRRRQQEHAEVLAESLTGHYAPEDFNTGDEIQFRRDGISATVLRKLRRGQYAVQGSLDLHGLTRQQGHQATLQFVEQARQRSWRCIKIIHGKGLRSPQGLPVLKRRVEATLRHHEQVLAYCSAPSWAGGHGAVLILLKKD